MATRFPLDGPRWTQKLVQLESTSPEQLEGLYADLLPRLLYVPLHQQYTKYIQKTHPISPDATPDTRKTVIKAFLYSLDLVGLDYLHGADLWSDYLRYLHDWQPATTDESNFRQDLMRKALEKLITLPSNRLEDHWQMYSSFETDLNPQKGRKVVNDHSAAYMKLRSLNIELKNIIGNIKETFDFDNGREQLEIFNAWIDWETLNKMNSTQEEVEKRINFVYNLSVQYCPMHPSSWFNYSIYLSSQSENDSAIKLLNDAIETMPRLELVKQLSNLYESQLDSQNLNKIWTNFIANQHTSDDKTDSYIAYLQILSRISIDDMRQAFQSAHLLDIQPRLYTAYAEIEARNNPHIGKRIYQLALTRYSKDTQLFISYLDYITLHFPLELKQTIESQLTSKEVFKKYYEIESKYGSADGMSKVMNRYLTIYPHDGWNLLTGEERGKGKINKGKEFRIGDELYGILRVLPSKDGWNRVFDEAGVVNLFKNLKVPE